MKRFSLILLFLGFLNHVFAQNSSESKTGSQNLKPLVIVDGVKKNIEDLEMYQADSIATITVYKDSTARKLYGNEGENGVLDIKTKAFVRSFLVNLFKKSSSAYDSLYTKNSGDHQFAYILNGIPVTGNYLGNLSELDEDSLDKIEIISKEDLASNYSIADKEFGILLFWTEPQKSK
ncbi:hypothetical protein [Sphingobacterium hungaricum]